MNSAELPTPQWPQGITYPYSGEASALREGLYLGLFNGRADPRKAVAGWGYPGPIVGPLEYMHTTYNHFLRLKFREHEDFVLYKARADELSMAVLEDRVVMIDLDNGCLALGNHYFGDWTLFHHRSEHHEQPRHFERAKPQAVR